MPQHASTSRPTTRSRSSARPSRRSSGAKTMLPTDRQEITSSYGFGVEVACRRPLRYFSRVRAPACSGVNASTSCRRVCAPAVAACIVVRRRGRSSRGSRRRSSRRSGRGTSGTSPRPSSPIGVAGVVVHHHAPRRGRVGVEPVGEPLAGLVHLAGLRVGGEDARADAVERRHDPRVGEDRHVVRAGVLLLELLATSRRRRCCRELARGRACR